MEGLETLQVATELNRLALKTSSIKTKLSIHYKLKIHGIYTNKYPGVQRCVL